MALQCAAQPWRWGCHVRSSARLRWLALAAGGWGAVLTFTWIWIWLFPLLLKEARRRDVGLVRVQVRKAAALPKVVSGACVALVGRPRAPEHGCPPLQCMSYSLLDVWCAARAVSCGGGVWMELGRVVWHLRTCVTLHAALNPWPSAPTLWLRAPAPSPLHAALTTLV